MKTSDLIKKLIDSLSKNGDIKTNINEIGWYCLSEGGSPEMIILDEGNNSEEEIVEGIPF